MMRTFLLLLCAFFVVVSAVTSIASKCFPAATDDLRDYWGINSMVTSITLNDPGMASDVDESRARVQNQLYHPDDDLHLLERFLGTLDPDIMKECAAVHDRGGEIDLDYLSTCGDFELYARYMHLPKLDAVKKFEYVMLYSTSLLEFKHRLAL